MPRRDTPTQPASHGPAAGVVTRDVPLDLVDAHPRNYNLHPPSQIEDLTASLELLGQYRSVVLVAKADGRYTLIGGHGVGEAARRAGLTHLRADVHPVGTPEERVIAMMIADNLHAERSLPDPTKLAELLQSSQDAGISLPAIGSSAEHLTRLLTRLADEALADGGDDDDWAGDWDDADADGPRRDPRDTPGGPGDPGPDDDPLRAALGDAADASGALLERLTLDLLVPTRMLRRGEVWRLGHRAGAPLHVLLCAPVFTGWPEYAPWLARLTRESGVADDGRGDGRRVVLAPYAGPLAALSSRAERDLRLVMAQPDGAIAGHILDRYREVHGDGSAWPHEPEGQSVHLAGERITGERITGERITG